MDIRSRVCTVSFFGSDDFVPTGTAERQLEALVTLLLRGELFVEFLLGRSNAFDLFAVSVICRCREAVSGENSTLTWVYPTTGAELRADWGESPAPYNGVEFYWADPDSPPEKVRKARDRYMLQRSQLSVFFSADEKDGTVSQRQRPAL